jgi:hypothetical protein
LISFLGVSSAQQWLVKQCRKKDANRKNYLMIYLLIYSLLLIYDFIIGLSIPAGQFHMYIQSSLLQISQPCWFLSWPQSWS